MLSLLSWVAQKSISKSGSLRGKGQHGAQDIEAKGLTLTLGLGLTENILLSR